MGEINNLNNLNIETVMAFDFGLRRIGVAVGQKITGTASPVSTILAKNGEPDWAEINHLIKTWKPSCLVVGIPILMDGSEQEMTQLAKNFSNQLKNNTHSLVFEIDERLSTREARQILSERDDLKKMSYKKVDALAACLIAESYLREI